MVVQCPLCDQTLHNISNLTKHIQRKHSGEKRVKCPFCPKDYKRKCDLRKHVQMKHAEVERRQQESGEEEEEEEEEEQEEEQCQSSASTHRADPYGYRNSMLMVEAEASDGNETEEEDEEEEEESNAYREESRIHYVVEDFRTQLTLEPKLDVRQVPGPRLADYKGESGEDPFKYIPEYYEIVGEAENEGEMEVEENDQAETDTIAAAPPPPPSSKKGKIGSNWNEFDTRLTFFCCLASYFTCVDMDKRVQRVTNKARVVPRAKRMISNIAERFKIEQVIPLPLSQVRKVAKFYGIIIHIWTKDGVQLTDRQPTWCTKKILNLLLNEWAKYEIITSLNKLLDIFQCVYCEAMFQTKIRLDHHQSRKCPILSVLRDDPNADIQQLIEDELLPTQVKSHFKGGRVEPKRTIHDRLARIGIDVGLQLDLNKYFAVADIETLLGQKMERDEDVLGEAALQSRKLIMMEYHTPIAISVISNLDSQHFDTSQCFIGLDGGSGFIENFLRYLSKMSEAAYKRTVHENKEIFDEIDQLVKQAIVDNKPGTAKIIGKLQSDMDKQAAQFVVLFYNSTFDLTCLSGYGLAWYLNKIESKTPTPLKRGQKWIFLRSQQFRFLDVLRFVNARVSLSDFLYAYGVEDKFSKLAFPYELMRSVSDLKMSLTDVKYEDFWSELKQTNTLNTGYERYQKLLKKGIIKKDALKLLKRTDEPQPGRIAFENLKTKVWEAKRMTQLWHYLPLYCSVDCLGVMVAVERMKESFMKLAQLDMLEFNTLPSLSYSYALKHLAEFEDETLNYVVKLGPEAYKMIVEHIFGGAANVYKRLGIVGYTKIRSHTFETPETLENILLLDFNTLYGSSCLFECPVLGSYSVREKKNKFYMDTIQERGLLALSWLQYEAKCKHRKRIQTILGIKSEKVIRLSKSKSARLDGWIAMHYDKDGKEYGYAFEYHGDVVHSNPDRMSAEEFEHGINPINKRPNKDVYRETVEREEMIRKHPQVIQLFTMWEHRWKEMIRQYPFIASFVKNVITQMRPNPVEESMSWERCLQLILEKKICGVVRCSLETPPAKMSQMVLYPPFWLHRDLTRKDLCEVEKRYAVKYDMLSQSKGQQGSLCNELNVEDTVITSDLLRFYVEELGLVCTNIETVIQFRGAGRPWLPFLEKCIKFRIEGKEKGIPVQVAVAKAMLNTFFGSSIIKAEGRHQLSYVMEGRKLDVALDKENYLGMRQAGPSHDPDAMQEVKLRKMKIYQNAPKQIGFWILNWSKMILLRFIHMELQYYLRPGSFEIYATDTDSVVLGVAMKGTDLRAICKPELWASFNERYETIFVTREEDGLTPLLLKLEQEGKVFVGLAPKGYQIASEKGSAKIACKGITHTVENLEVLQLANYLTTVFDVDGELERRPIVRGIRSDQDQLMRTYMQTKKGLRRFCPKVGYFRCAICNYPRELKDDPALLKKLYPFMTRDCGVDFESALGHINENFKSLLDVN